MSLKTTELKKTRGYHKKPLISNGGSLVAREFNQGASCQSVGCESASKKNNIAIRGKRNSDKKMFILGHPDLELCKNCADEWLKVWNNRGA